MILEFEKWHGCKNDFIVTQVSKIEQEEIITALRKQSISICNRDGSGIGADGILVLIAETRDTIIPDKLVIINQDGSIAKNCGNGIRCAAGYIHKKIQEHGNSFEDIETVNFDVEGTDIICRYLGHANKKHPYIAVEMGVPLLNSKNTWHEEVIEKTKSYSKSLQIEDVSTCAIGNPHVVLYGSNLTRTDMLNVGSNLQLLENLDGINVHLANTCQPTASDQKIAGELIQGKISEIFKTYTWERGVGETQACGSGACSVAAPIFASGFIDRKSWIAIDMPGGRLYVKHQHANDPITLAGPAEFVFEGKINI